MQTKELQKQIENLVNKELPEPANRYKVQLCIQDTIKEVFKESGFNVTVSFPRNCTEQYFNVYNENCNSKNSFALRICYKLSRVGTGRYDRISNSHNEISDYKLKEIDIWADEDIEEILNEQVKRAKEHEDEEETAYKRYEAFVKANPDFFEMIELDKRYYRRLPQELRTKGWHY